MGRVEINLHYLHPDVHLTGGEEAMGIGRREGTGWSECEGACSV